MKIAFFDSGMGGLTVLHEALQQMPYEEYIYFADSNNAPYGIKSSALIEALVYEAIDFLDKRPLKALVLACNTATSVAIKQLRREYDFPIIGMEPAIKPAVERSSKKKTLLCATEKTLEEEKLQNLILNLKAESRVVRFSLQELVMYAEHLAFEDSKVEAYLKEKFRKINWNEFDSMVLGCTHFPYFKRMFEKLIPSYIHILDGNEGTVRHLKSRIELEDSKRKKSIEYFISGKKAKSKQFQVYFDYLASVK